MKLEIIYDDFNIPFSDLVDKERFEVVKTERENVWLVKKLEKQEHE